MPSDLPGFETCMPGPACHAASGDGTGANRLDDGPGNGPAAALPQVLRRTMLALVRDNSRDLTSRQLGVLLTVYLSPTVHHGDSLAKALRLGNAAITRALDRLEALDLVERGQNPANRRCLVIRRTARGHAFLAELQDLLAAAARQETTALRAHPRPAANPRLVCHMG